MSQSILLSPTSSLSSEEPEWITKTQFSIQVEYLHWVCHCLEVDLTVIIALDSQGEFKKYGALAGMAQWIEGGPEN